MEKGKPSTTTTEGRSHSRQSVPKVLSTGRKKPDLRCRPPGFAPHVVDHVLSRELDELRHMSIGSPVPTPRPDDDPLVMTLTPSNSTARPGTSSSSSSSFSSSSSSAFPLIRVDGCDGGSLVSNPAPPPAPPSSPTPSSSSSAPPTGSGGDDDGDGNGGGGRDVMSRGVAAAARRNSDTLATPCHVPRSTGSKVVRYTFGGSEDAASD